MATTEPSPLITALPERAALADQWKIVAAPFSASRSKPIVPVDAEAALALEPGSWSSLHTPDDGDYHFYHVTSVGSLASTTAAKADAAFKLLGDDAQRALMKQLLTTMDNNKTNVEEENEPA